MNTMVQQGQPRAFKEKMHPGGRCAGFDLAAPAGTSKSGRRSVLLPLCGLQRGQSPGEPGTMSAALQATAAFKEFGCFAREEQGGGTQ